MAKPEWGTKRTCPKCGARFYDLEKPFPLECVSCGATFEPEVVLKSKQGAPEEPVKKPTKKAEVKETDDELEDDEDFEDIEIDDDDDDDLIGDDDDMDDDEDVDVIKPKRASGGDED